MPYYLLNGFLYKQFKNQQYTFKLHRNQLCELHTVLQASLLSTKFAYQYPTSVHGQYLNNPRPICRTHSPAIMYPMTNEHTPAEIPSNHVPNERTPAETHLSLISSSHIPNERTPAETTTSFTTTDDHPTETPAQRQSHLSYWALFYAPYTRTSSPIFNPIGGYPSTLYLYHNVMLHTWYND